MSSFTPEQQDELTRLVTRMISDSREATLLRQLNSSALGEIHKRSGNQTVTVTWPGGSATSNTVPVVTHNWGAKAKVLPQLQDQTNIGPAEIALLQTVNGFSLFVQTLSFIPLAGTTGEVTVLYWEP